MQSLASSSADSTGRNRLARPVGAGPPAQSLDRQGAVLPAAQLARRFRGEETGVVDFVEAVF